MEKIRLYLCLGEAIGKHKDGTLIKLDCSHYIHDIEYKRIADESEKYIERLNR